MSRLATLLVVIGLLFSFSNVYAMGIEEPITNRTTPTGYLLEYSDEFVTIDFIENITIVRSEPRIESEANLLSYQQKLIERRDYAVESNYSIGNVRTTITFSNPLSQEEVEELARIYGFKIVELRYISTVGGGGTPYPIDRERLSRIEQTISSNKGIPNFVLIKGYTSARVVMPSINVASTENSNLYLIDVGPIEFLQLYPNAVIIPGRSLFYRYNKTIVAKDTTPPQITHVKVTPHFTNSLGTLVITANVTDDVVVDSVTATIGEAIVELSDIDGDGIFNATAIPPAVEGTYTVNISAFDLAGNSAYNDSISVVVDNTPPAIEITSPANDSYIASGDVAVVWNASDSIGISRYELLLDGVSLGDLTETIKALLNLTDGLHATEVRVFDLANNSASDSVVFTIDTIPPEIGIIGVANGSYHNTDAAANVSVADAGLKSASILLDATAYTSGTTITIEGIHLLEVHAEDLAGNSASQRITFIIDKTPPRVSIASPLNGSYARQIVEITGAARDINLDRVSLGIDGIEVTSILPYSWNTASYPDGMHVIELRAVDKADNSASASVVVFVDNTPPDITVASPLAQDYSYTKSTSIDFSVTDELSGVASSRAYLDGREVTRGQTIELFNFSLGEHALKIEASDNVGNNASETVTFRVIDDVPPVSSDNADKEWHNSDIVIAITAWDEKSTVKEIHYAVNQGSEVVVAGSAANATISYEDDNNTIRYYAVDEWGNAEAPRLVDGIKLDKTPPVVRLWLDPAKDEYFSDELLPVRHEAYDPVIQGTPSNDLTLIFDIDGAIVEDPSDIADFVGTHTLILTAIDDAGNKASVSLSFTVVLRAEVDIDPDTLNLKSEGRWITAYIEFPLRYNPLSIKINSVALDGVAAESDPRYDFVSNPVLVDKDGDGLPEFVVKFDRGAVEDILEPSDAVNLSVRGEFSAGIFEGSGTIRVIHEGNNKSSRAALKLNKHVERKERSNQVTVRIDLFAVGSQVESVFVQEYIPEELGRDAANGVFTDYGLMWDVEKIEQGKKQSVEYTLIIPEVSAPITYKLRTVVEYQTAEDLKSIEEITYLVVEPDGQVKLREGHSKSAVKEKGGGYTRGSMGRRYDRGGDGGEGQGRGRGSPENPGRGNPPDAPPGNPNPGPPDNPGQPDNPSNPPDAPPGNPDPGNPNNPSPGNPNQPENPGNPDPGQPGNPENPNPGQPENPGNPNPGNPNNPPNNPGNPNPGNPDPGPDNPNPGNPGNGNPGNGGGNNGGGNGNSNGGGNGGDDSGGGNNGGGNPEQGNDEGNDKGGEKK